MSVTGEGASSIESSAVPEPVEGLPDEIIEDEVEEQDPESKDN